MTRIEHHAGLTGPSWRGKRAGREMAQPRYRQTPKSGQNARGKAVPPTFSGLRLGRGRNPSYPRAPAFEKDPTGVLDLERAAAMG
jgi:hypothetical protein